MIDLAIAAILSGALLGIVAMRSDTRYRLPSLRRGRNMTRAQLAGITRVAVVALALSGCATTQVANPAACGSAVAALAGALGSVAPLVAIGTSGADKATLAQEETAAAINASVAISAAAYNVSQACKAVPVAAVSVPPVAAPK